MLHKTCWQERLDKKRVHEKELKSNHCTKTVLQCKILNFRKSDVNSYKPLQSIYNLMHGVEHVTKGVMQKQAKGKWQEMQRCLLKFYIKLQQHFSTTILYCCLNVAVIWKSPDDFPKLKMFRVLVYLLKCKFHFNRNWIFVAIYIIQKLKTKTCFSQTLIVKACFPSKNCN